MAHEIKLTQGALSYARELLQTLGWAKTTELIIRGGQLLTVTLPEPTGAPSLPPNASNEQAMAYNKQALAWINEPLEPITLTDKQVKTLRAAVDFVVESANLRAGPQSLVLLTALGYDASD